MEFVWSRKWGLHKAFQFLIAVVTENKTHAEMTPLHGDLHVSNNFAEVSWSTMTFSHVQSNL